MKEARKLAALKARFLLLRRLATYRLDRDSVLSDLGYELVGCWPGSSACCMADACCLYQVAEYGNQSAGAQLLKLRYNRFYLQVHHLR